MSAAAISQLEGGDLAATPETIDRLSLVLGCSPSFFSRPWRPQAIGEPFFRSRRSTPQGERDRAFAYAVALAEIVEIIETYVEMPRSQLDVCFTVVEGTKRTELEDSAQALRSAWELPAGPIPHVVRLLETKGAVAAAVGAFDPKLDAFSVRTRSRPVVVLCSDNGNAARRRFDAAHELAHLVLHPEVVEANNWQEQQAQAFASAFLLPAEEIEPWLPRRSDQLELLEDGSVTWGVSMQALLYRARSLKTISEDSYRRAMQRMSAAGWRTSEPIDIGPAEAPELLRLAIEALPAAGASIDGVAKEIGLPKSRLMRMLSVPEEQADTGGQLVRLVARSA